MPKARSTSSLGLLLLLGAAGIWTPARAADAGGDATDDGIAANFGTVKILDPTEVEGIRSNLGRASVTCRSEGPCQHLTSVARTIFGARFNPSYPDLIAYIDKEKAVQGPYLLWKESLTPHLYGARNVWVMLFWEIPREMEGPPPAVETRITTLGWAPPNPLALIFQRLSAPAGAAREEKETGSTVKLALRPIGEGDQGATSLYFAVGRFPLEADTSNRISIYPVAAEHTTESRNIWEPKAKDTVVAGKVVAAAGGTWPAKAHSIHAEFSNSRGSWGAGSIAAAGTLQTRDTALGESVGDNFDLGGYVFLKLYLFRRPTVRIGPNESGEGRLFRGTWAVLLGTNVTGDNLNELVVGIGRSHLFGRLGLFAGMNSIAPSDDFPEERKERLIVGADYVF